MADNYGWCQSCGALVFGSSQCHKCDGEVKTFCVDMQLVEQAKRIKELEAELREIADQMMEFYEKWDKPEKGTLLGWHQRIIDILTTQATEAQDGRSQV